MTWNWYITIAAVRKWMTLTGRGESSITRVSPLGPAIPGRFLGVMPQREIEMMTAEMTWESWIDAVFALTGGPRVPEHLRDIVLGHTRQWHDDGMSVNDAVVELRYLDACRKADRNA